MFFKENWKIQVFLFDELFQKHFATGICDLGGTAIDSVPKVQSLPQILQGRPLSFWGRGGGGQTN